MRASAVSTITKSLPIRFSTFVNCSLLANFGYINLFLQKKKKFINAQTPDFIFLDLNLPKKNGLEVLTEIKESEEFKKIPVIMLTTSSSASDIAACYNRHVNCFITKPIDADSFLNVVTMTENFWIQVVTLPNF